MDRATLTKEQAYAVLGVPVGTPLEEVTARYRLLMKSLHPDVAGEDLNDFIASLNVAYDAIKNQNFKPSETAQSSYQAPPRQEQTWQNPPRQEASPQYSNASYYGKAPDGTPFGYEKKTFYDGEAFGTPTKEDTKLHKDAEKLGKKIKLVLFPALYNILTTLTRVLAGGTMVFGVLFFITRNVIKSTQYSFLIWALVCLVSTLLSVLLKYTIYKSAERDFTWNQEFRI